MVKPAFNSSRQGPPLHCQLPLPQRSPLQLLPTQQQTVAMQHPALTDTQQPRQTAQQGTTLLNQTNPYMYSLSSLKVRSLGSIYFS